MSRALSLFVFCFVSWTAVASPSREFIHKYSSARVQIPAPAPQDDGSSSDPEWLRWFLQDVLGREPDSSPKVFASGCAPDDLENALRRAPLAAKQASIIETHLRRCLPDVATGVRGSFRNSTGLLRLKMNLREHPLVEKVLLRLPGGVSVHGLLALKGDKKPRPFVVARIGIFSNVDKFFAEQFALMQMFEQGPANMLVLESTTGAEYISENPGFNFADGVEALQNLQIAKILRDKAEPLSALVGSLHFMGISLGAHGLFATAAFDPKQAGGPRIDGFMAFCPLVHPKTTFARATERGVRNVLGDVWASIRLRALKDRGFADRPWGDWLKGEPGFLKRILDYSKANGKARIALGQGLEIPAEWLADPVSAAEPWPWFSNAKAPFLVVATKDDGIVPPDLNVLTFEKELRGKNLNAGVVILDEGFHCTLPIAYDWNTMSALMNGAMLATDSSWKSEPMPLEMDLGDVVPVEAVRASAKVSYKVDWPKDGEFVTLRTKIEAPAGPAEFSMNLPVSEFDFRLREGDLNEPARRMLERWLHRSLTLDLVERDKHAALRVTWPRTL